MSESTPHVVMVVGPPLFQAYGADCSCGWVGPTRLTEEAARLDGRVHLRDMRMVA